jgi:hypothetical protein
MRRRFLAVSVCIGALLAAGAAPAGAAERKPCAPKGARTVLLTNEVQVVSRWDEYTDATRVWGCDRRAGRRILITPGDCSTPDIGCGDTPPDIMSAGKFVAFSEGGCIRGGGCGASVTVLSLRSGRRASSSTDFYSNVAPVTRRGWLAWVDTGDYGDTTPRVRALNADGRSAVLDTGSGIDLASLAVGDRIAYWTHAGVARSAALP